MGRRAGRMRVSELPRCAPIVVVLSRAPCPQVSPALASTVLFFHGLSGLENACDAGRVAPGQFVLFNGASFLADLSPGGLQVGGPGVGGGGGIRKEGGGRIRCVCVDAGRCRGVVVCAWWGPGRG
jgi:hypothetical protein